MKKLLRSLDISQFTLSFFMINSRGPWSLNTVTWFPDVYWRNLSNEYTIASNFFSIPTSRVKYQWAHSYSSNISLWLIWWSSILFQYGSGRQINSQWPNNIFGFDTAIKFYTCACCQRVVLIKQHTPPGWHRSLINSQWRNNKIGHDTAMKFINVRLANPVCADEATFTSSVVADA